MSDHTNIQWCDSTFNPWMGCTKISPACDHCYAERDTARFKQVTWGAGQPRKRTSEANWKKPLTWNKRADVFMECSSCGWRGDIAAGRKEILSSVCECGGSLRHARRRVFCASLADVFDNEVPDQWRTDLFDLIKRTPNIDWMLLTKRIGNVSKMLPADWGNGYTNVWLGITVCNQSEAERDIDKLWLVPSAIRWISIEPMLESMDLMKSLGLVKSWDRQDKLCYRPNHRPDIDMVVVGGESGPGARQMNPDWPRLLRDQCATARVAFFMKQLGGSLDKKGNMDDLPEDLQIREWPIRAG